MSVKGNDTTKLTKTRGCILGTAEAYKPFLLHCEYCMIIKNAGTFDKKKVSKGHQKNGIVKRTKVKQFCSQWRLFVSLYATSTMTPAIDLVTC